MASGFLSSAACSISICLSTWASVSGPSKVISTPSSLAAFSAPVLTACQNWCWNPLEMIGIYSLSPSPPAVAALLPSAAGSDAPSSAAPALLPPLFAALPPVLFAALLPPHALRMTTETSSSIIRIEIFFIPDSPLWLVELYRDSLPPIGTGDCREALQNVG